MIEVLCGCIASGKSTWAKKRAEEGWIIINDDAIVMAVHGNDYTLYHKSLKPLYKAVEDNILHTAVAMGKSVVIDRGLDLAQQSRQRWIALAKSLDIRIVARTFKVEKPEIHAKRRMESDGRGLPFEHWIEAAERHFSVYEPPTVEEGFDCVY
jgi:predicted kinase